MKRKNYSKELKSKVALAAIKGNQTPNLSGFIIWRQNYPQVRPKIEENCAMIRGKSTFDLWYSLWWHSTIKNRIRKYRNKKPLHRIIKAYQRQHAVFIKLMTAGYFWSNLGQHRGVNFRLAQPIWPDERTGKRLQKNKKFMKRIEKIRELLIRRQE